MEGAKVPAVLARLLRKDRRRARRLARVIAQLEAAALDRPRPPRRPAYRLTVGPAR
jgi:hypothetical protein